MRHPRRRRIKIVLLESNSIPKLDTDSLIPDASIWVLLRQSMPKSVSYKKFNAGYGIRTRELLRDRILSPAPLASLANPAPDNGFSVFPSPCWHVGRDQLLRRCHPCPSKLIMRSRPSSGPQSDLSITCEPLASANQPLSTTQTERAGI